MALAHVRRCPEGEEEAGIERMADPFVEEKLAELARQGFKKAWTRLPDPPAPDLILDY
jgi:hypothetical protein